jgi:hypothetical protein
MMIFCLKGLNQMGVNVVCCSRVLVGETAVLGRRRGSGTMRDIG